MKNRALKIMFALTMATMISASTVSGSFGSLQVYAAEAQNTYKTPQGVADLGKGQASITIQGNSGQTLVGKNSMYTNYSTLKILMAENLSIIHLTILMQHH